MLEFITTQNHVTVTDKIMNINKNFFGSLRQFRSMGNQTFQYFRQ